AGTAAVHHDDRGGLENVVGVTATDDIRHDLPLGIDVTRIHFHENQVVIHSLEIHERAVELEAGGERAAGPAGGPEEVLVDAAAGFYLPPPGRLAGYRLFAGLTGSDSTRQRLSRDRRSSGSESFYKCSILECPRPEIGVLKSGGTGRPEAHYCVWEASGGH